VWSNIYSLNKKLKKRSRIQYETNLSSVNPKLSAYTPIKDNQQNKRNSSSELKIKKKPPKTYSIMGDHAINIKNHKSGYLINTKASSRQKKYGRARISYRERPSLPPVDKFRKEQNMTHDYATEEMTNQSFQM
jgi:hypothetical protein